MSDHFVVYQGWSLTREVTVVKFRAQKVTGTLETGLSIGPDRMTPCNPIPNVTSFSDSKGLIQSGPIVVLFKSFSLIPVIIFFFSVKRHLPWGELFGSIFCGSSRRPKNRAKHHWTGRGISYDRGTALFTEYAYLPCLVHRSCSTCLVLVLEIFTR